MRPVTAASRIRSRAPRPGEAMRARVGRAIAAYLDGPSDAARVALPEPPALIAQAARPGDVLLVEGDRRVSVAIKYLTRSNWSHAVLHVGRPAGVQPPDRDWVVEADLASGVRLAPLESLTSLPIRICRPSGLAPDDRDRVVAYALSRVGHRYDLANVLDLARYLLPRPPVPARLRRRLIALGSGDPTRAICSTLIAQAFQAVRYPILPEVESLPAGDPSCDDCRREILHVRHHSLFVPRDFDLSPYFDVVKPRLAGPLRYRDLPWAPDP